MISHDIDTICEGLEFKEGLWSSRMLAGSISYPEEAHQALSQTEESSFWFQHRNQVILKVLKLFPPQGLLFDIGGGNGFVTAALQEAGHEVVLLEPGTAGIHAAQKRGVKHVIAADFKHAGILKGQLPAAGLFDVLEHIDNDQSFLESLAERLCEEGRLYMTVPAFQFLWSDEDAHAGHYRRYTLGAISNQLERAGFMIEFKTYFFSVLPIPIFFLRVLPSRLGLFRKKFSVSSREHRPGGVLEKMMRWFGKLELQSIERLQKKQWGSSCFIVASRKKRATP